MKQILFYTDTPNVGGAEKHMLLLAKYLVKKGVKVSLAYGKYSQLNKMRGDFEPYCENIYSLNVLHKHDPRHYSELKAILKSAKFDLIHLHLWNPGACRYAFFAAYSRAIPIVTTEHDPFEITGPKRWIKDGCLEKTSRIITVSSDNYHLLNDYYRQPEKKLELVPNGIEIESFLIHQKKADLPIKKGEIVIVCIAELHRRKGHRYLLDAFQRLQAHIPTVRLFIVGRGPEEERLKDQYSQVPHLHFLGWRDDVQSILRTADILVLPSLKEAFGLVLLEAMASNVVCLATNNGGPTDIIQDGVTGYLAPPASSEALLKRLLLMLRNPHQLSDIRKAALDWVKENFTAEKMAEKTLGVYEKVW